MNYTEAYNLFADNIELLKLFISKKRYPFRYNKKYYIIYDKKTNITYTSNKHHVGLYNVYKHPSLLKPSFIQSFKTFVSLHKIKSEG